jgi:hypothetical protein
MNPGAMTTTKTIAALVLALKPDNVNSYSPVSSFPIRSSRHTHCRSFANPAHVRRHAGRLNMADINTAAVPRNGTESSETDAELDTHSTFFNVKIGAPDRTGELTPFGSSGLLVKDETQIFLQSRNLQEQMQNNQVSRQTQSELSWKDRLIDISNIASFLCVLDCTLLPLVSIALPALSWLAGGLTSSANNNALLSGVSSIVDLLPALGHGIALFFVIPVGLLTTVVNYVFGHKQLRFSAAALFGVLLIYAANSSSGIGIARIDSFLTSSGIATHSHGHVHDACGAIVGATTGMLTHTCAEGWAHRLTNTLGCAFLLASNHYGKKFMESQSKGCAASALAEAWGGNDAGRRLVCPPGCGCEQPSYGASRVGSNAKSSGEMFFSWDRASRGDARVRGQAESGSRSSRFKGRFRQ